MTIAIDFYERLRPASWRGVPFEVLTDSAEFGRRIVVHDFVGSDSHYVEDLGRKNREFTITAFLAGSDRNGFNPWPQRDALIAALEQGGVGELIHPFYGTLKGHISGVSVAQATTQGGGLIQLTMPFIEAGERDISAAAYTDLLQAATADIGAAYVAVAADFNASFDATKGQGFVLLDAAKMTEQFIDEITDASRAFTAKGQAFVNDLTRPLTLNIAARVQAAIAGIVRLLPDPERLLGFTRPAVPKISTTSRNRQRQNSQAFTSHVTALASIRKAEIAIQQASAKEVTRAELATMRKAIAEAMSERIFKLSDLDIFEGTQAALVRSRTSAVRYITDKAESAATTFVTSCEAKNGFEVPMPSIVLAYQHYGTIDDELMIRRNGISNPLFIPRNASVELLTNA